MEKGEALRREVEETRRQARAVEIEIERMAQQIPNLEEKVSLAEQKNLQEQARLGLDPIDIQPSKEFLAATRTLEENAKVLEKFTQRRADVLIRLEDLQVALLEDELIQQAKLFAKLKEREGALDEELKTIRQEIEKVEKKKEEIALRVAERTSDQA